LAGTSSGDEAIFARATVHIYDDRDFGHAFLEALYKDSTVFLDLGEELMHFVDDIYYCQERLLSELLWIAGVQNCRSLKR